MKGPSKKCNHFELLICLIEHVDSSSKKFVVSKGSIKIIEPHKYEENETAEKEDCDIEHHLLTNYKE